MKYVSHHSMHLEMEYLAKKICTKYGNYLRDSKLLTYLDKEIKINVSLKDMNITVRLKARPNTKGMLIYDRNNNGEIQEGKGK